MPTAVYAYKELEAATLREMERDCARIRAELGEETIEELRRRLKELAAKRAGERRNFLR